MSGLRAHRRVLAAATVVLAVGAAASPAFAGGRTYLEGSGPIYAPAPPPQPPAPPPSNRFGFGKARLNRKRGTASLPVRLPGPGLLRTSIAAAGHGAKSSSASFAGAAGTVRIAIAPSGKLQKKLLHNGKVKVKVTVVFTPNGGAAASQSRLLTLVERRH